MKESVLLVLFVLFTTCSCTQRQFHVTWYNGTVQNYSFNRTPYGDCIYDYDFDTLRCMRDYRYRDITRIWKYKPEMIRYVSVRCLEQEYFAKHKHVCMCKNGTHSAHPNRQLQYDQHYFCHVTRITRSMLSKASKTEVVDMSSNMIAYVHGNAFDKCASMKYLNLGNNPIRMLPAAMLCYTHELNILILNNIGLTSFPLHIFDCNDFQLNITFLDLSNNNIVNIISRSLKFLPKLVSLKLSNNAIKVIPSNAFAGGVSLLLLDLSRNELTSLPPDICDVLPILNYLNVSLNAFMEMNITVLEQCTELHVLDLSYNKVKNITGSLNLVSHLKILNLSNNRMSELPENVFTNASRLIHLDLSHNLLLSLPNLTDLANLQFLSLSWNQLTLDSQPEVFSSLQGVLHLNLGHNKIEKLGSQLFLKCQKLETLDLSFNNINSVDSRAFYRLNSLQNLSLNHNNIVTLPEVIFESLNELIFVDLSYNKLLELDNLKTPTSLWQINLERNSISGFPTAFSGSNISELLLSGNNITSLPVSRLKGLRRLSHLDLQYNRISLIEDNAFTDLSELEYLNLGYNELNVNLSKDVFKGADSLLQLYVTGNKITSVDNIFNYKTLWNLTSLDVSHNNISSVGRLSSTKECFNCTGIKIERIILSECMVRYLSSDAFIGLKHLQLVDLSQNEIKTFPPIYPPNYRVKFSFKDNLLFCSCNMSWLAKERITIKDRSVIPQYVYKVDKCKVFLNERIHEVKKVPIEEYLCQPKTCCDNVACCTCFARSGGEVEVTVCSHNSLQNYPLNITQKAKISYVDGNRFDVLSNEHYDINPIQMNTQKLYLNFSGITTMKPSFFRGFVNLQELYLNNNKIKVLESNVFEKQGELWKLNLTHNEIGIIYIGAFNGLMSRRLIVDLRFNKLQYVDPAAFLTSSSIKWPAWINMNENPWKCDCLNFKFRNWLEENRGRLGYRYDIYCNGTKDLVMYENIKACEISRNSGLSKQEIIIVVIVLIAAICILFAACLYYRRDLVAILYDVTGFSCFRQKYYGDKNNDIYLCYDTNDSKCSEWIDSEFLPRLKTGKRPYSVIIPDRTTLLENVGNPENPEMVSCKCCVVVVSKNMHTNDVCLEEFRKAYDHSRRNPNYKVILIIFGDVDISLLEPQIRMMMAAGNYITARSSSVWSRLRYELPDPQLRNQHMRTEDDVSENDVVIYSSSENYQYVTFQ